MDHTRAQFTTVSIPTDAINDDTRNVCAQNTRAGSIRGGITAAFTARYFAASSRRVYFARISKTISPGVSRGFLAKCNTRLPVYSAREASTLFPLVGCFAYFFNLRRAWKYDPRFLILAARFNTVRRVFELDSATTAAASFTRLEREYVIFSGFSFFFFFFFLPAIACIVPRSRAFSNDSRAARVYWFEWTGAR